MGEKNLTKRKVSASEGWQGWLRDRYLAADPRWLGVFRIYLGLVLTVDFGRRWNHALSFYSNDGILPNHYSIFAPMGRHLFSVFHAFSTVGEVSVLFAIATVSAVLFAVGYKTKLFHIVCAVLITSVNARNIFVENGGTVVTNILTLWTLFLPLGSRISVDAVIDSLKGHRERTSADLNDASTPLRDGRQVASLAILALTLNWSVIYFFNTVHKTGHGWHDGTAIWWFWQQDRIVTWFSVWAREHVPIGVVRYMTWGTLVVEGTLSGLLLIPFAQKYTRPLALMLAVGLHGGIAAMSRLGPFSYVMAGCFIIFLRPANWAWLERWFARPSRVRTIIYDADCGVCFLLCRILRRLDPFGRLTFIGNDERSKIPERIDDATLERTVVVVDATGAVHVESRAVYEAIRVLPLGILFVLWMRVPGLSAIANVLYRAFAKRRLRISAWIGLGVCGVPEPVAAPAADERVAQAERVVRDDEEDPAEDGDEKDESGSEGREGEDGEEESEDGEEESESEDGEGGDDEDRDEADESESGEDEDGDEADESESGEDEDRDERSEEVDEALTRDPFHPHLSPYRLEVRSALGLAREMLLALLMVIIGSQVAVQNPWLSRRIRVRQPAWMATVVDYPRVHQGWTMFAPEPPYEDGRLVVDGRTADGRKLDPLTGEEPEFDPYTETGWGHDQFWCDYHNRIRYPHHSGHRQHLRRYLQRHHELFGKDPADALVAFDVWWIEDKSPPPGETRGVPLRPKKLLSFGRVKDSGAEPWLRQGAPR